VKDYLAAQAFISGNRWRNSCAARGGAAVGQNGSVDDYFFQFGHELALGPMRIDDRLAKV